jgi:hypothetical protein
MQHNSRAPQPNVRPPVWLPQGTERLPPPGHPVPDGIPTAPPISAGPRPVSASQQAAAGTTRRLASEEETLSNGCPIPEGIIDPSPTVTQSDSAKNAKRQKRRGQAKSGTTKPTKILRKERIPCPKCLPDSGKLKGHFGRHITKSSFGGNRNKQRKVVSVPAPQTQRIAEVCPVVPPLATSDDQNSTEDRKSFQQRKDRQRQPKQPCPKCVPGSGKLIGHMGRHVKKGSAKIFGSRGPVQPVAVPKQSQIECPRCIPGSGKLPGHFGRHITKKPPCPTMLVDLARQLRAEANAAVKRNVQLTGPAQAQVRSTLQLLHTYTAVALSS